MPLLSPSTIFADMKSNRIFAHLSLLGAAVIWGLMAPIGKAAMQSGFSAISLASLRMIGAAVCFWIASLFVRKEEVRRRDYLMMFFAALLGIVLNQGFYTFGLSLTSPVDASIIVTVMPIITMVLAAVFLKEPVTLLKALGVLLGFSGAVLLILSNSGGLNSNGNVWGNLLCLTASLSFACYLTIFRDLISRYTVFTLMRWMFTYSAICFIPFALSDLNTDFNAGYSPVVWAEVAYVVFFGTFVAYIFMLFGQQNLRPTVVSMYNYVQPIVSTSVSVVMGLAVFGYSKAVATLLIFAGVYAVTQSKARKNAGCG